MKQNTFDKKDGMLKKHSKKKFWKKVVAMLSCVTVFCTSYTMIMPAMTMSETTYCGQEEGENHTHTLQCYSNPNADLETEANWTATIPTLTGNWNEDVVAVANSQLGYQESTANYQVADNNEKKGYNRYGAWMNEPYADWNTDFVLFCLHYANVDTNSLSLSNDLSAWASNSAYVTKDSYTPKAGDLIILDENNDGSADHAAIITEANGSAIKIVEGDYSNAVGQENYDTTDARVIGYIQMPSNPAMQTAEETAESTETEETAVPEETTAPEETVQPEPTAAPEATEPAETAEPQETVEPEMTAAPQESSAEAAVPVAPSASKRMMPKIFRAPANTTVDITDRLANATITIDGKKVIENEWSVKPSRSYRLTLSFQETSDNQFPNDGTWMTYKIPDGLSVEKMQTTFDMIVDGKVIHGNQMVVDEGIIKFQWNTSDPNFIILTASNNAHFDAEITGSIDTNKNEIIFSDDVTRTVNVDNTHNVKVEKSGSYKSSDGKIHYTVTVTSSGNSKDVVVTDTIDGTALTYDNNVAYTSTKGATATMSKQGNGFTATIPSMSDGEHVNFTYTATIDFDELKKSGTVANGVEITCPDDHDNNDNQKTHYVSSNSISSLSKNAQNVSETVTENGKTYRTITWNLKANEEPKKHLTYISDSISDNSQKIMKYSGDGLTIVVTKEDGKTETRTVKWNDSSIYKTDTGWTYNPPESDGKASYNITYTTKVDVTQLIASQNVSNSAETDYNSTTRSASVSPSKANEFSASKSVVALADDKTTWEIKVNVPAIGLDKLEVTDTLPNVWINGKQYYDSFGKIISVEGRDGEEGYVVDSTSDTSKFTMTFYKDKYHKKQGMNSSAGNRTIMIRYTTTNNKDWIEYGKKNPDDYNFVNHLNNAKVNNLYVQADAVYKPSIPSESTIKKSGNPKGTYPDSNPEWQIFEYNITLKGAEDNQTLTDTFDTTHLKYFDGVYSQWYTDNTAGVIYGGTTNWPDTLGGSGFTVEQTKTGLTFYTGTLPRQQDGTLYPYYRIHYYLKVRISDAQQQALSNGGEVTYKNSVKWGTKGDEADVTYSYNPVKKSLENYEKDTNTAKYKITVNEDKKELNNGSPMKLEDKFENQVIDYSTIIIEAKDKDNRDRAKEVSYDFSGNTGTFTIPDSTYVTITYDAKPIGKIGDKVTITNKATVIGCSAATEKEVKISISAAGGGDIFHLKLMKYADGNMQEKLSGAIFQLYDENRLPLKYDIGDSKGQNITFTTGIDGIANIRLSASQEYSRGLEVGKRYYLKEIQAPEGYQVADEYIPFTISEDGRVDPAQNLYANGGTINVADKKITKVSITLKKVDSGNIEKSLQDAVFDLYGSDYVSEDGDTNAVAITSDLKTDKNGTVPLGILESGTYYLVETQAPKGYGKEKDPIKLKVQDDKVTVDQGGEMKDFAISDDSGKQTAVITVTDDQAYNLPKTGGTGTTMIYIAGGVLVAVAVVMFVMQKRKRG